MERNGDGGSRPGRGGPEGARNGSRTLDRRRLLRAGLLVGGIATMTTKGFGSEGSMAETAGAGSAGAAAGATREAVATERKRRVLASPQFRDGKFHNPIPVRNETWKALRRWIAGGENTAPAEPLPVVARKAADFDTPPRTGLRVTWLGHSTMLVEIGGKRFLTDPVFGPRASPSTLVGPKRFHVPPLPLGDLPRLDAVVLSHDHYDHLDAPTFEVLRSLDTVFICPLGVGERLSGFGVPDERIREFDWWEETEIGGVRLAFTPARHFSGRGLFDRDETLWGSWVFIGGPHRAYFSGDGGMFPGFAEIGAKYGPFDVTMMEAGAYDTAWTDVHMGPEQALRAHIDLRGKVLLPAHWGTFDLALHPWTEPVERLIAAAKEAGALLALPKPGASFEPTDTASLPIARWWPQLPWKTAAEDPIVSSGLG